MVTWSDRIKALRATGLKLAEIGELVGLAPSSVSDIEQGRTSVPGGDAALKLDELYRARSAPDSPEAI